MAERIKAALRQRGLSVKGLAEAWAVDRSGLSDRINGERLSEPELQRIADVTQTTPAYLRYGIEGDYRAGYARALAEAEQALRALHLVPAAPRPAGTTTPPAGEGQTGGAGERTRHPLRTKEQSRARRKPPGEEAG